VAARYNYANTTASWVDFDCVCDGVTNGDEVDPDGDGTPGPNGTDPNDPCDFTASDITLAQSGDWLTADCDSDGLTNGDEVDPDGDGTPGPNGTDPNNPDSDGDGVTDGDEVDPDGDGTPGPNGTDPNDPCDFTASDITLTQSGDWLTADCDSDGLTNGEEMNGVDDPSTVANPDGAITDPNDPDSDGDGNSDGIDPNSTTPTATDDIGNGVAGIPTVIDILDNDDYLDNGDTNNLGTTSLSRTGGTAIGVVTMDTSTGSLTYVPEESEADSTVTIIYEVCNDESGAVVCATATVSIAVVALSDSDGDGITDAQEAIDGTDPQDDCDSIGGTALPTSDCDGDGETNAEELTNGTNPNDPCSGGDITGVDLSDTNSAWYQADCDGDTIANGTEVDPDNDGVLGPNDTNPYDDCDSNGGTPRADSDCDNDGLTNGEEETLGIDPFNIDTDGDTISDGQEVVDNTDPLDGCSSIGGTPPEGIVCDIEIESDLMTPVINGGIFRIINIELFPDNTVEIYNRWGVKVFEINSYDNQSRVFRGVSNGRSTIKESDELPVGVYFYIIKYRRNEEHKTLNGYLYINR
ncbi:MAG: gliding motility-associated C-terminal domain-containing protein, partial [Bacteroidota bacterium]